MERFEKEHTYKTTYYKSWDGQVFRSERECIEYENNPAVVAWKNVQSFLVRRFYEGRLSIPYSEDERPAYVFKPTSHEDIIALNHFLDIDQWGEERAGYRVNDYYIGKNVFVVCDGLMKPYLLEDMMTMFKEKLEGIINNNETDIDYDDEEEKIIRVRKRQWIFVK